MWFGVVTLFAPMFSAMNYGVLGRALIRKWVSLHLFDPRDWTSDVHRTVDDRPFGGGPGMVMKAEPLWVAIDHAKAAAPRGTAVVYVSPQGQLFDHARAKAASRRDGIIFVAGRYEGIDQRVLDNAVDEEWSLGDFVLSGGEFAVMAMIDSITRLLPDVLGDVNSANEDSFADGLLDCPHYTRPEVVRGYAVPAVLRSGDHRAIRAWRKQYALRSTWLKRPDLLARYIAAPTEQRLLKMIIETVGDDEHEYE